MKQNYMMDVHDVMDVLGVKESKAYSILRELNKSLAKEGYIVLPGKIPRAYWEKKFYSGKESYV